MASLPRRALLISGGALALIGCRRARSTTVAPSITPPFDMARLNREVGAIARRLEPGVLGAGLMNLESSEVFTWRGDRRFPLQSVFKAPLAAAALAEIDAGRLSLDERFTLKDMDLSPPWSPIADAWPARRDYTTADLLHAAVAISDNTAADVLMARIGGPGAVTAWLVSKRIEEIRVDRYEREVQAKILGVGPFRPEWKGEAAFGAAQLAVSPADLQRAMAAYQADPRDTATPEGMLTFLDALLDGALLSPASTRRLLALMSAALTGGRRILAGLPKGSALAHKTGTGPARLGVSSAINDAGIVTLPDKRMYCMEVFVARAPLSPEACEDAIAQVTRAFIRGLG